jgi:trans-aconitate methyltransferase
MGWSVSRTFGGTMCGLTWRRRYATLAANRALSQFRSYQSGRLPSRDLLVDAGAGNGKVTAWFTREFKRTLAIEPNPYLCEELRGSCPTAEVLPDTILAAQPTAAADLVLCSHVFYYIDGAEWMRHLERLAAWLAPHGVLVVLQNHETDCMRLAGAFLRPAVRSVRAGPRV